ncbi:MAG: DMT family transporter [Firmicutes bacterium]|nr:DMT family transporter [Bacillota bacterium]
MGLNNAKFKLIIICMIFGTIGTFRRFIELPSGAMCFCRAVLAVLTILAYFVLTKQRVDMPAIKRNLKQIILLGALMATNWVCQFEAFRYTSIAISTVCYYTQPIFFLIGAALVFKEKLTARSVVCICIAFGGMILVSGVTGTGVDANTLKGIVFAVAGAITYAVIVIINKSLKDISTFDLTMAQLAFAAVMVLPYVLMTEDIGTIQLSLRGLICLLIVGVVHTGIAYVIYFGAVKELEAQTVAIISYIDPVEAVLLSAFLLHEPLTAMIVVGAAMILGATLVSELKQ